jgi:hypothetical protein
MHCSEIKIYIIQARVSLLPLPDINILVSVTPKKMNAKSSLNTRKMLEKDSFLLFVSMLLKELKQKEGKTRSEQTKRIILLKKLSRI